MVKYKFTKLSVIIILSTVAVASLPVSFAQPEIGGIYIYPTQPTPLSTITFTIGLYKNNSSIDDVRLIFQECMDNFCFIDSNNISLNYSYSCCMSFYKAKFTLGHPDATQIKYHVEILSNGIWYGYNTSFINIVRTNDKKIDNPKDKHTPGFDFLLIVFSIFFILILTRLKKKIK